MKKQKYALKMLMYQSFLDIKDKRFLEKDLKSNLLEHIQEFYYVKKLMLMVMIFISIWCFINYKKYQLYLPTEEELMSEVENQKYE